eukprot:gnl/TRDRNA2_/TRDRNA2_202213_c0_seq1.p1 gnl/TRDRNA2_/TRDRNA2_202213_c0~~gnl/TRDRNA2_/TRDRNA2_202213_c0_seq1.p1  ORF type:complete len:272 (-),score=58.43 gnl/TRDRNA2_/TRDRNA2_202213_c0_seq1:318-1133(-)
MQVNIEVVGAGAKAANGIYVFTEEFLNEKPIFKNSAGLFLSFKKKREAAGGWGIRKEKDNDTLYRVNVERDLPSGDGWEVFRATGEAVAPAPTLKIAMHSIPAARSLKRNLDHVFTIQEESWKHRKFSDAEIVCAGVRTAAHRGTLSAASRVFDAAFSSTMTEGQSAIYEIKEATPTAVEAMLHHIYTGILQCQTDDLPSLFTLAMRYELDALGLDVAGQMLEDVNVENVRDRLAVLKLHREKHIAECTLTKIIKILKANDDDELIIAALV